MTAADLARARARLALRPSPHPVTLSPTLRRWARDLRSAISAHRPRPALSLAWRELRRWVAALAFALGLGVAQHAAAGCAVDDPPAADAAELPACADLAGCAGPLLCSSAGVCQCRRPGLPPVECQR